MVLGAFGLLTAACGDDGQSAAGGDAAAVDAGRDAATDAGADRTDAVVGFYPCDVEAVLRAKCHTCHTMPPRNGAPMSLLTWAATQDLATGSATVKIWQRAREYVTSGFMPLAGSPTGPLTAAEKVTLLTWLENGAVSAAQACTVADAGGQ